MSPAPTGGPWQAAIDRRLLRRLLRRGLQPGVIDPAFAVDLVARLETAARSLPLLAYLSQRYGETALQPADVPIVYAQPRDEGAYQLAESGRPPATSPGWHEDVTTAIVPARAAAPHDRSPAGAGDAAPPLLVVAAAVVRPPDRVPAVGALGLTSGAHGDVPVGQRPLTVARRSRDGAEIRSAGRLGIAANPVAVVPARFTETEPDGSHGSIEPAGFDGSHQTAAPHLGAVAAMNSVASQERSTSPADRSPAGLIVTPARRRSKGRRAAAGIPQPGADALVVVETRHVVTFGAPDALILAQGPPLAPAARGRAATATPPSPFSGRGDGTRPAEQAPQSREPRGATQAAGVAAPPSSSRPPAASPLSPPPPASPTQPRTLSRRTRASEQPEPEIDIAQLAERVQRRLRRQLAIERERKGWHSWT